MMGKYPPPPRASSSLVTATATATATALLLLRLFIIPVILLMANMAQPAASLAFVPTSSSMSSAFSMAPSSSSSSLSLSSSATSSSSADAATTTTPIATTTCAVVGCGVLGTSLCQQILADPNLASWKVTGITKSDARHNAIRDQVGQDHADRFQLDTLENIREQQQQIQSQAQQRFHHVVFCAPPSGFDNYAAAVEDAITNLWQGPDHGGIFVFTSSGGIYGTGQGETVTETSPVDDDKSNPRTAKLIQAEQACLAHGGTCLRLAGLYLLDRGAHSYWLNSNSGQPHVLPGRGDAIVNLVHYDDAAAACLAALVSSSSSSSLLRSQVFLISDGHATTRQGILKSAVQASLYRHRKDSLPTFAPTTDNENDKNTAALGKIYNGSYSNQILQWKPKHTSFDAFMAAHA